MSINLEHLYRQVIMDNYKNPKNKGLIDSPEYSKVHLNNPSCGDDIHIATKIVDGKIADIRHDGHGCSICCSSASVMSEVLKDKELAHADEIIQDFFTLVQGQEVEHEEELDEALAYRSVSQFPARIKCATLSWKAMESAIKNYKKE